MQLLFLLKQKMSFFSKPAFLKKKKQQTTDEAEEAKEEDGEAKEQKDNEANQAEEEKQEGAEAEGEATEEDQTKKTGLLDNLKNIKTQVMTTKKMKLFQNVYWVSVTSRFSDPKSPRM